MRWGGALQSGVRPRRGPEVRSQVHSAGLASTLAWDRLACFFRGSPPLSASLPILAPAIRMIDKETWSWTGDETFRGPSAGEWQSWVSSLDLFISKICSFSSHPISLPEPLLYTGLAFLAVSNYSFIHLFVCLFFSHPSEIQRC